MIKKFKFLSSIMIIIVLTLLFLIMFFSFGITSSKNKNSSLYNSDLVTSYNESIIEESEWSLEQIHTSTTGTISNSSVILTDIDGNDHAYVWGDNSYGQLGLGDEISSVSKPTEVTFPIEYSDIKFLSTYNTNAMAVLTDENGNDLLYTWGDNTYGQLGMDIKYSELYWPTQVKVLPEYDEIKSIDIGENAASIVLTIDGKDTLWTTGYNGKNGALGLGDNYYNIVSTFTKVSFPEPIYEIKNLNFDSFSTLVATNENGENILYVWGASWYFQSGSNGVIYKEPTEYKEIPSGFTIKDVASSERTMMTILIDSHNNEYLYSWGDSTYGQAGNESTDNYNKVPTLVEFPDDADIAGIKEISMGATTSSAITIDSSGKEHIYLWGDNSHYLMGNPNSTNDYLSPTEIKFSTTSDYTIKEISLGQTHAGMIVDYRGSNQLYMWGNAYSGALGQDESGNEYREIKKIQKWNQTPEVSLDNGQPVVVKDSSNNKKMLSFTLDWGESVSITKIEIVDSEGYTIYDEFELNTINKDKETIIDIAKLKEASNVRLKISNENNVLLISQSFDIPYTFKTDSLPIYIIIIIILILLTISILTTIVLIIKKKILEN